MADIEPVPSKNYPRTGGTPVSGFPFGDATTKNLFPSVCDRSHWDPTMIYRRSVPERHVGLPTDFRPWSKVCLEYKTSGPVDALPYVPDTMVFPMGGEFYPPQRWSEHIDNDTLTKRLDRPLKKYCDIGEFIPPTSADMYQQRVLLPDKKLPQTQFIDELSMPKVLLKTSVYECRERVDTVNWDSSHRLFNNPTKQDRYHKFQVANYDIQKDPAKLIQTTAMPRHTTYDYPGPRQQMK